MKKVLLLAAVMSLGLVSSASAAPLTLPVDFTSDLTTTAGTFAAGALLIWGAIAVGKLGVTAFKKFFG